jgi:hypothetical protein
LLDDIMPARRPACGRHAPPEAHAAQPCGQYVFGCDFRVCYDVNEPEGLVLVKAVGIKVRNNVYVGGKEIAL